MVADDGFDGTVVQSRPRRASSAAAATLSVAAGEDWDALVARAVADGLGRRGGLSGIPGPVGATPIQNVGAYGQEVAQTVDRGARGPVRAA